MRYSRPSNRPRGIHKTLEIEFKVDDVVDAITAVIQNRVSADENVTVAAGWRRQTTIVVVRNRVNLSPHVPVEYITFAKSGFIFWTKLVTVSEPRRPTVMMLIVPITRSLAVAVIEPGMILAMLIVAVLVVMILIVVALIAVILVVTALIAVILILSI